MKISQLQWEAASRAARTRRDAFGIVLLASVASASVGIEHLWIVFLGFLIPDAAFATSLLIKKISPRVIVESQVALYPSLLIVLGVSGGAGAFSDVLVAAGAGWLLRIAIQRLVGGDFLLNRE